MTTARQPAVAGLFYPGDPAELRENVDSLLAQAEEQDNLPKACPKALIAPHAGYAYSGSTAAMAYHLLEPYADRIRRVVLLGPSHRVGFSGIATCSADVYDTPLGAIPLDKNNTDKALDCPGVTCLDQAHLQEHSLEVHLPFLQSVLGDFELTPLVVGDSDADTTGRVINALWGGEETLIVISSDLSHFLDYDTANKLDHATCRAIENFDGDAIEYEQACGRNPIKGLLAATRSHPLTIKTLGMCNSGDATGDKSRVVGYGAWALWEEARHA
ncbi:MAG: AmmeMemoRadiSam system protein B [Ketobacteraceae bacterium]|nr:AmmeMemoRadiSam system protein B [Ketobacteraceae bacterium]